MSYAFTFQGDTFTPDGRVPIQPADVDAYNRAQEQAELAWLRTAPDKVFAYAHLPAYVTASMACGPYTATELDRPAITTWPGTSIATHVCIGPRRYIGFDRWTYRRAVTCRIYGVRYYGWYMESSGSYCRLRKAKGQSKQEVV